MTYSVTKDLETGNALIDSEHRQLFAAINDLMDACSSGHGRDRMQSTAEFLKSYVAKHFSHEEELQANAKYPDYPRHKQFHDNYKKQLFATVNTISTAGANIATLAELTKVVGVLVSHIRVEDKKLAAHLKNH